MERNRKVLVIAHNDLDGYGAGIVAKGIFGYNCDTYHMGNWPDNKLNDFYQKVIDEMKADPYDTVFIVDLRVPLASARLIDEFNASNGNNVFYVCDHHKSSLELQDESYEWCYILSDDRTETHHPECGTSILYDVIDALQHDENRWSDIIGFDVSIKTALDLKYSNVRNFIKLVRLWDTFAWEDIKDVKMAREAVLLNELFKSTSGEYIEELVLGTSVEKPFTPDACTDLIVPKEFSYLLGTMREHEKHFASSKIKDYGIQKYLIVDKATNTPSYYFTDELSNLGSNESSYNCMILIGNDRPSIALDVINTDYPDIDLLIIWDAQCRKISFRVPSGKDFDAGKLALSLGGGGHRQASGVSFPNGTLSMPEEVSERLDSFVTALRELI